MKFVKIRDTLPQIKKKKSRSKEQSHTWDKTVYILPPDSWFYNWDLSLIFVMIWRLWQIVSTVLNTGYMAFCSKNNLKLCREDLDGCLERKQLELKAKWVQSQSSILCESVTSGCRLSFPHDLAISSDLISPTPGDYTRVWGLFPPPSKVKRFEKVLE